MENELRIVPLPAFSDNYIWLLRRGDQAVVVDPGDAEPVSDYLARHRLHLSAILVTHHHRDHVGGIGDLLAARQTAGVAADMPIYGPAAENIASVNRPLSDGEQVQLPEIGAVFEVIAVPGHTRGHIAYYGRNLLGCGVLLCGDTLFACGCGRLFEGTAAQMQHSLSRLAALPPETLAFCAHEYTESNIRFAQAVEPGNGPLAARAEEVVAVRARSQPTVPTSIALELATNPFLRWHEPEVIAAAARFAGKPVHGDVEVFAAIREWKNKF